MRKLSIPLIATCLLISTTARPYSLPMTIQSVSQQSSSDADSKQWGLNKIDAQSAWAQGITGKGILVAVIDTGIDYTNKDLSDHIAEGINIITNGMSSSDIQDTNGHGSEVASIIAGTGEGLGVKGVAPDATLMPIKVTLSSGTGSDSDVAKGIRWAADHGANIINISMGETESPRYLQDAITYAQSKGCLIVAAAGNHDNTPNPGVLYPAAEPGVLAVSAVDNKGAVASFVNNGSQIDLSAPGVHILGDQVSSSYSHTGYEDGTSEAAPFVSGAAALLWSAHPEFTADQVSSLLEQSAVMPNDDGRDEDYGFGLTNVSRALNATVVNSLPSSSSVDYSGGVLKSDSAQLTISPFTFNKPENISLQAATAYPFPAGYSAVGSPISVSFPESEMHPLKLTLSLPSAPTANLSVFRYSDHRWVRVGGAVSGQSITASIFKEGIYQAAVSPSNPSPSIISDDPIQTSINVANATFPTGTDTVVIARSDNFSDALAGVPLAVRSNAPILLNPREHLDARILNAIQTLAPSKIIILGGDVAVSKEIEDDLSSIAPVVRYAGQDRYSTAAQIALSLGFTSKAYIVNGTNYSDALSIAPFAAAEGAPILLSDVNDLPESTQQALNHLRVTDTIIAGGNAVISESVKILLPQPLRLAGSDAYATNQEVLNHFNANAASTIRVPGTTFAPALVESVRAALSGRSVSFTK